MRANTAVEFWARVSIGDPDACWPWQGSRNDDGYGVVSAAALIGQHGALAHRVAYALVHGVEAIVGVAILHRCDNPPCCNDWHLFRGDQIVNMADRNAKGRQARLVGETNPNARLTASDVARIRQLYAVGGVRQVDLATQFGIPQTHISRIVRGVAWRTVAA